MAIVGLCPLTGHSTTYYIDYSSGCDCNNGTSAATPWMTLAQANSVVYSAGDQILFKSGEVWTGSFHPQGSGSSGSPIVVSNYGSGELPIINGADSVYYAEVKITPNSFDSGVGAVGFSFLHENNNNRYAISLNASNRLLLNLVVDGVQTTLASKSYTISAGTEYLVAVTKEGDDIEVYVDGNLELTAADSTRSTGRIALHTWKADAYFDDVAVSLHADYPDYGEDFDGTHRFFPGAGTWSVVDVSGDRKYHQSSKAGAYTALNEDANTPSATVWLHNQEHYDISNLEIIYPASTVALRRGVFVKASDFGTVYNVKIHNNVIHDIYGDGTSMRSGAIVTVITGYGSSSNVPTRFDGLSVEGNYIYNIVGSGITMYSDFRSRSLAADYNPLYDWYPSINVRVRSNSVDYVYHQGIFTNVCDAALVEYNRVSNAGQTDWAPDGSLAIWVFNSDNAVYQYNEASSTNTTRDGAGFNADYNSRNSLFQYNYSHDNLGGAFLVAGQNEDYFAFNDNATFRYNISQNDGGLVGKSGLITLAYCTNATFYNNVFYTKPSISPPVLHARNNDGWTDGARFYNNVFYYLGDSPSFNFGGITNQDWDYNVFYGNHATNEPSDPNKLTSDPQFANPGGGGDGIGTLLSYRFLASSPLKDSGKMIASNGGKDFYGKTLYSGNPDRGAYEGYGLMPKLVDNFDDGNAIGWTQSSATWSVASVDGDYHYRQGDPSGWHHADRGDSAWSGYLVEAKVKPISYGSVGAVTLSFLCTDGGNGYFVSLASNGDLKLKKSVSGTQTELDIVTGVIQAGVEYTIKAAKIGTTLKVWLNGVAVLSATDSTYDSGKVSVGTWNATADFDDIIVQDI